MKLLHISYHKGCIEDFNYVAKKLNVEVDNFFVFKKFSYNIGEKRANDLYNQYKDYFDSFDVILTSDTAPLSRIFLQNNFKKLIIWICNRFDYAEMSTNDCEFPDIKYYELFKNAITLPNVKIASYTEFEHIYANKKGIPLSDFTIKPIGNNLWGDISISSGDDTFFIPDYHNDTIFMNLKQKCIDLGINVYQGRYNGPNDLKKFKGIIHIPYAWSNLALFENLQNNLIYFIPSKCFLLELSKMSNFWWQNCNYLEKYIEYSEWYHKDYEECFVYFDSWEDLVYKIKSTNFDNKKQLIKDRINWHTNYYMNRWKDIIKDFND